MKDWGKYVRPTVLLLVCLLVFFKSRSILWIPLLLAAVFFIAIDLTSIGRTKSKIESVPAKFLGPRGVLGTYTVDSTESYGLFIELLNVAVFIDIRRDAFLTERERLAQSLFANQSELNASLVAFIESNPEYKGKLVSYIGLHSVNLEQGEVFWSPNGYTLLRGMRFVLQ